MSVTKPIRPFFTSAVSFLFFAFVFFWGGGLLFFIMSLAGSFRVIRPHRFRFVSTFSYVTVLIWIWVNEIINWSLKRLLLQTFSLQKLFVVEWGHFSPVACLTRPVAKDDITNV